jgi:pseudouridine kinase
MTTRSIIVIGGMNMDLKAKVTGVHRLATSNPGEVTFTPGGVARNIAVNLAKLGDDVTLLSCVGNDSFGNQLLEVTAAAGVDVAQVIVSSHAPTGVYSALIERSGEMISAVSDMRAVDQITPDVIARNAGLLESASYIIADCNLAMETLHAIAQICAHKLIIETVSVEKSGKLKQLLSNHPILASTPNLAQVEHLVGTRDLGTAIERLHAMGLQRVVIHMGPEGALASDGETVEHAEAQTPAHIVDVTGAGDAAMAGLVHGLLHGKTWRDSAAAGQSLAARVIASAQSTLE